ncbi:MAG: phosphatase PAP2 family protein [Acidobacteriia bacterium]|nr:phosphatase PAP2 family protein [Terriglobia bacterium]
MVWQFIEARDHDVMRRVHHWRAPRWLRVWMISATRLGDGWIWYSVGIALLFFGGDLRFVAIAASAAAEAAAVGLFRIVKNANKRKRPCQLEAHCWSNVLPPDQFSFPSGHSMSAFAIAVPLCIFYPELQAPLLVLSVSIAVSRVILGMHFVSDVVVGSLLGIGLGYGSYLVFR